MRVATQGALDVVPVGGARVPIVDVLGVAGQRVAVARLGPRRVDLAFGFRVGDEGIDCGGELHARSMAGTPIWLVEAELARRRGRPVEAVDPDAPPSDQAIAALAELRASIDELERIAGRLARSAVAHGASWADVATSLRLDSGQTQAAYAKDAPS